MKDVFWAVVLLAFILFLMWHFMIRAPEINHGLGPGALRLGSGIASV